MPALAATVSGAVYNSNDDHQARAEATNHSEQVQQVNQASAWSLEPATVVQWTATLLAAQIEPVISMIAKYPVYVILIVVIIIYLTFYLTKIAKVSEFYLLVMIFFEILKSKLIY